MTVAGKQRVFTINGPTGVLARVQASGSLSHADQEKLVSLFAAAQSMEAALAELTRWAKDRGLTGELLSKAHAALDAAQKPHREEAPLHRNHLATALIAPGCSQGISYQAEVKTPFTPRRFVEIRARNRTEAYRYARSRGFSVLSVAEEPAAPSDKTTLQGRS